MQLFDMFILYGLISLLLLLLILFFYNRSRDQIQKKLSLLFEDSKKKTKSTRSPNLILGLMVIFSKVLARFLPSLLVYMKRSLPLVQSTKIEKNLQLAGYPFLLDAHGWHWLKVSTAFVFFLTIVMISSGNEKWSYMIYAVPLTIAGYYYPDYFLSTLLQKRKNRISRELPDAMDFLSLSLAAGMNFQLAVEEYVRRNETMLADEFSIFINQIDVGVHRVDAFELLLDRNESAEMRSFLSSVIQSERLGTSLRPVIASQAEDLRDKRKQFVEKMIAQAPVKMLFPMMFFILPAMLIITISSVLLPQSTQGPAYTLVEQNFIIMPVTPDIQVKVNGKAFPLYYVQKTEVEGIIQLIPNSPKAISSPEQRTFLQEYFEKNRSLNRMAFFRIDLPAEQRTRLYIELRSENGKVEKKTMTVKPIHFNLDGFQDGRMDTQSSKVLFKGKITSDLNLSLKLNQNPIETKQDEKNPELFVSSIVSLRNGRNDLLVSIKDRFGGLLEKSFTVRYAGIALNAQFKEREATLGELATLEGEGSQGSTLFITRKKGNKFVSVLEHSLQDSSKFSLDIPLEVGLNEFRLFLRKETNQSPILSRLITRKMTD
jgi:tight adherence protein C